MKRISSRITLIIICCSCVTVLLAEAFSLYATIKLVRSKTEAGLVQMSEKLAAQFSHDLLLIENKVEDIYIHVQDTFDIEEFEADPDYLERYSQELAPFMKNYADKYSTSVSAYCYFNPELSREPYDIYFVDGDGDNRADRQAHIPLEYFNDTPEPDDDKYWWYGPAKTGKLVWTNPYRWTLANNNNETINVVSCAKPLFVDGKLIAVVGTYYRADRLIADVRDMKVYNNGYAALVNEKMDFVVHPDYLAGNRNNSDNMYSVEEGKLAVVADTILANDSGVVSYSLDSGKGVVAYASLSNGWKILIYPDVNEIYSDIYTLCIGLAAVLIVCIGISALLARKLGTMIAVPIQTMVEATRKIGGGNLNVFVEIDAKDEMQELVEAFNEMVSNVSILNHELTMAAYYDPLTGMENKNLFEKQAHKLLEDNAYSYAYIILDINKFKLINDLFGVEQGDNLLIHVSTALSTEMRDGELAARFNADHFHLLFRYNNRTELEDRLRSVWDKVTAYTFECNPSYKLSIVFGVYVVEEDAPVISLVGDRAKLALDKVKGLHSFAVHFYNDNIRHKILEEQEIENIMEASLASGEFKVYLQPKYDPYTNQIIGSEALVRWAHPQKGIIQPDQFIPIFERNSFIAQLDMYMLEEVCKLIRGQIDDGIEPMLISVNQSRQYLNPHSYLSTLTKIVDRHDIPYRFIELEITETALFKDQDEMLKIVNSLHDMGFVVSLDDFGSGYSSFNMLQDMTIDVLKIDKNFFKESVNSDRGKKIVCNIILMAHELGISVIAEGVETLAQVEFLKGARCDAIQGYYYSRPVPQVEMDIKWREQAAQGLKM